MRVNPTLKKETEIRPSWSAIQLRLNFENPLRHLGSPKYPVESDNHTPFLDL